MVLVSATSCKDMDDNYKEYLDNIPTYAPAVRNLRAVSSEPGRYGISSMTPISSNRCGSW